VVVGSGPNGLAAAITLAQSGCPVLLREGAAELGGGLRSEELTLPGFLHDVCATVLPLGVGSPFFRTLPLTEHGLSWVQPPTPLAHPFDDGTALVLERSAAKSAEGFGKDRSAYLRALDPFATRWSSLAADLLSPPRFPRSPLLFGRFALLGLRSAQNLARTLFVEEKTRGLFAGLAAHGGAPLENPLTGAFGLVLAASAHAVGWPLVRGGSRRFAEALASYLRARGGEIALGVPLTTLGELAGRHPVLLDVTPRQLAALPGGGLSQAYCEALARHRHGPGVFKMDWALDRPIPWRAAACARAGTVHLGATLQEISGSERTVAAGGHPERPYVVVVQPTLFDPTRAPPGKHVAWAYCHVPNGSRFDMSSRIEAQLERFAPGFGRLVLGRSVLSPAGMERHNPNYVGGDISGGLPSLRALLKAALPPGPYETPSAGLYLCSSSTPPGGGVHGMCGYHAAQKALRSRRQAGRSRC
jgi:phytoene dehydrogenase-like protein